MKAQGEGEREGEEADIPDPVEMLQHDRIPIEASQRRRAMTDENKEKSEDPEKWGRKDSRCGRKRSTKCKE